MRNSGAVVVRQAAVAIGVGLVQHALLGEATKGCSPVLCTDPVAVEPPYQVFNAQSILAPGRSEASLGVAYCGAWTTLIVLPAEEDGLSLAWMETLLRAVATLAGPLAFELIAVDGRVAIRFAVPMGEVAGFRAALLGHFPRLVLRKEGTVFPRSYPSHVLEFVPVAPYHRTLTLLGNEGASPLGLALQVLTSLPVESVGLVQVLFAPTSPAHDWHYNIEQLLEAEDRATRYAQLGGLSSGFQYDGVLPPLAEPSAREKVRVDVGVFAVIIRCAVWHANPAAQDAFAQGMQVAMGMLRFGNRAWRVLSHDTLTRALGRKAVALMVRHRRTHRPGVPLTSRELASIVHIPNARTLALCSAILQRTGFAWTGDSRRTPGAAELGTNTAAGTDRRVMRSLSARLRHTHVAGATGSGKSEFLKRLILTDASHDLGVCLVDPHGDLCLDVLARLSEDALSRLVYLSFGEPGLIPVWNLFCAPVPPGKLADDVTRALLAQTTTTGPRMEHHIRMLAYVIASLKGTFEDFAELAAQSPRGEALAVQARETVGNPQVTRYLQSELPRARAGELASVRNKLSRLLLDDALGAVFRQQENTIDPRAWMDAGRIVLVNLAAGSIGADHARFVGSLLVSLLYRAGTSRADIPARRRRPFLVYIDEFQLLQAATLAELLSEGRKYGLGAILAHQERGQLGKDLAHALGNCGTKVVFRPSEDDLPALRRVLGQSVDDQVLRTLGVGEALVAADGTIATVSSPLTSAPVLRDPRAAARSYAETHYAPITQPVPTRKPRVYDTFGGTQ